MNCKKFCFLCVTSPGGCSRLILICLPNGNRNVTQLWLWSILLHRPSSYSVLSALLTSHPNSEIRSDEGTEARGTLSVLIQLGRGGAGTWPQSGCLTPGSELVCAYPNLLVSELWFFRTHLTAPTFGLQSGQAPTPCKAHISWSCQDSSLHSQYAGLPFCATGCFFLETRTDFVFSLLCL